MKLNMSKTGAMILRMLALRERDRYITDGDARQAKVFQSLATTLETAAIIEITEDV